MIRCLCPIITQSSQHYILLVLSRNSWDTPARSLHVFVLAKPHTDRAQTSVCFNIRLTLSLKQHRPKMNLRQEMNYCRRCFVMCQQPFSAPGRCFLSATGAPKCVTDLFKNLADDEQDDCSSARSTAARLHVSLEDASGRHENTIITFLRAFPPSQANQSGTKWQRFWASTLQVSRRSHHSIPYFILRRLRVTAGSKTFMHVKGRWGKIYEAGEDANVVFAALAYFLLPSFYSEPSPWEVRLWERKLA